MVSSIHCLRLLRSGFLAKAKESRFGGRVSEKENNMHSKALKQKSKTTENKKISTMRSCFLQFMLKVMPFPLPCKLLFLAAATPGPRNKGGPDPMSTA